MSRRAARLLSDADREILILTLAFLAVDQPEFDDAFKSLAAKLGPDATRRYDRINAALA